MFSQTHCLVLPQVTSCSAHYKVLRWGRVRDSKVTLEAWPAVARTEGTQRGVILVAEVWPGDRAAVRSGRGRRAWGHGFAWADDKGVDVAGGGVHDVASGPGTARRHTPASSTHQVHAGPILSQRGRV